MSPTRPATTFPSMSSTARPFEQTVDIETPELVVLSYSIAGIGSRVLAALTDLVICLVALAALLSGFAMLSTRGTSMGRGDASWALALLILLAFALFWGYYVLFEGLMDGQTPGKRIHRLRVVRDEGYSVTFGISAARNLVRIIDMQPGFFYLVGIASVMFTKNGRRLGDLVAGTIVVREEVRPARASVTPSRGDRALPLATALNEDEYVLLSRLVERWAQLDPARRTALVEQLGVRFAAALPADGRPMRAQLLDLHERERQSRA
ncbi:MAG: protein of unknown function transrane, partial [Gemmatimonadetes bacterium]|nr:protein of unknown function transrane [Gemmatimonadota bacterium]